MKAGKRNVIISHKDKLIYPESDIRKIDIVNYYKAVSPYMLPHLEQRPLMLQRFPGGIKKGGFYQKESSDYFPGWIETVTVAKEGGQVHHVVCNDAATLMYLANQGTITFHTWLSRVKHIDNPDKLIIDLDPPTARFGQVRKAALLIREFLDELSITSFLMTTGSSGLHIVIPLDAKASFDKCRSVGSEMADFFSEVHPDVFTTEKYKKKRGGKIYFDIQRNAYAQTAVAPYSLRPLPGAPVATPLAWDEIHEQALHAQTYNLSNILHRLERSEDPWKGMRRHAISINTLAAKMEKALAVK